MERSLPSSIFFRWGAASRPTILFVAAYALSMTPHEAAHAFVAYLLGFGSTLFQLWVNPADAQATPNQQAFIATAGPLFSVSVAVISLLIYRKLRCRPSGLVFLMFGMVGTYIFLGGVMATAMGGDFNIVLTALEVPKGVRYLMSAIGLTLLPLFIFFVGKELLRWAPIGFSRAKAVACATVEIWPNIALRHLVTAFGIWEKSDSDPMAVRFRDDFFPQAINWRKSEQSDTRLSLASAWG